MRQATLGLLAGALAGCMLPIQQPLASSICAASPLYTHCRIGQPLSLAGIAAVIGPRFEIQVEPPTGVDASERDPAAAARP
jgi:hypothetical protein